MKKKNMLSLIVIVVIILKIITLFSGSSNKDVEVKGLDI